jgi:hypothetical protein
MCENRSTNWFNSTARFRFLPRVNVDLDGVNSNGTEVADLLEMDPGVALVNGWTKLRIQYPWTNGLPGTNFGAYTLSWTDPTNKWVKLNNLASPITIPCTSPDWLSQRGWPTNFTVTRSTNWVNWLDSVVVRLTHSISTDFDDVRLGQLLNVTLHPKQADFTPGKAGRILYSTTHDDVYHTANITTKAGTGAQTEDGKIRVSAHVTPATLAAGRTVYFRVVQPDPDDASSYEPDVNGGDNRDGAWGPGQVSAGSAPVELVTRQGQTLAVAEVDLEFSQSWAGDNYQVQCSLSPTFSPVSDTTTVMTVWYRLYVEYDRMYKVGSDLVTDFSPDANSDPDSVAVENAGLFSEGDTVVVFDKARPGGETGVVSTVDYTGNLLWLDRDLTNQYLKGYGSGGRGAAVAVPAGGVYEIDTNGLDQAFGAVSDGSDGGCFVELSFLTDGAGAVPHRPWFDETDLTLACNNMLAYSSRWASRFLQLDCVQVIGASRYVGLPEEPTIGNTISQGGMHVSCVYEDSLKNSGNAVLNRLVTSPHEMAHNLGLCKGDFAHVDLMPGETSHVATTNHEASALCIMDYGYGLYTNAVMPVEFCTNCIYRMRDARAR